MSRPILVVLPVLALSVAAASAAVAPAGGAPAPDSPPVVHHAARIRLDPGSGLLAVQDTVTVPAGLDSFTVLAALVPGLEAAGGIVDVGSLPALRSEPVPADALIAPDGARRFVAAYAARLHQPTEGAVFSRERVGGEIAATVGPEGVFLAGRARWLPEFAGALAVHDLTIETPAGLIPVTNGTVVSEREADGRLVTVYRSEQPADGIDLVAGRYVVTGRTHRGIPIATYLLQPDERLAELYLERTGAYLDMYQELFGPYPFGKFATVENWFPTGYGMPGWTLLGGAVMRLPHIPTTSFGHEVCHNWWGNSVLVGEGGNWCEGLTTYWADYHYQELEGEAAARVYRRNLLKDYAAYVRGAAGPTTAPAPGAAAIAATGDFPLVEFTSRHSGATRAIGYGKSTMVWHMLDRLVGRERFLASLRGVYGRKLFQPAAWSDFLRAIEGESGRDLSTFRAQWLERAGAPALRLLSAERKGDSVQFRLAQDEPVYRLHVPVVVTTPAGPREEIVILDGPRGDFRLEAPGATRLAVDPDYHLFRRLDPLEIEPTINEVLGAQVPLFVLPADTAMIEAARAFACAFAETDFPMTAPGGLPPVDSKPEHLPAMVLLNPAPSFLKGALPPDVTISGDTAVIAGVRHDLRERDLVLAVRTPASRPLADLVVISRSPERLTALARRVVHYGKYSWLSLPAGRGEVLRGNWPPPGDPLAKELR